MTQSDDGAFTAVEAARMLVAVYGHPRWKPTGLEAQALLVARKFLGHHVALKEIRDHWACQYDHPRKQNEMYRGSYGIGITDGHRAAAIIARKALTNEPAPACQGPPAERAKRTSHPSPERRAQ